MGKFLEDEWNLNLKMKREHFMEPIEIERSNLQCQSGSSLADALIVEK